MEVSAVVPAPSQEFFSDVAYDYYGHRIATCNSDHTIKIWSRSQVPAKPDGAWECRATIQGRGGVFHRVAWAQPEFGQILAACSSDCNVVIFEEIAGANDCSWTERARLVDSHGEVHALEFAPRHLGLQLATLGEEGIVRIYEAVDMMQMSVWPLRDEFAVGIKASSASSYSSTSCLSWNSSPFDPPQLVVGRLDSVQIWQYFNAHRKWQLICDLGVGFVSDVSWSPNLARSYDLIAASYTSQDTVISQIRAPGQVAQTWTLPVRNCRLSWNLSGTMLATSSPDGSVQIFSRDLDGHWKCSESIRTS